MAAHSDATALGEIRRAIGNRVAPYISDMVVLLESIGKTERGKFLGGIKTSMRSEPDASPNPSGVPIIRSNLTIYSAFDHYAYS
jgi:hypothetical protein